MAAHARQGVVGGVVTVPVTALQAAAGPGRIRWH